ncbi:hypothetical protein ACEPPN_013430 [Leptodophora sp. 'Broadleaf-Isolate-01']
MATLSLLLRSFLTVSFYIAVVMHRALAVEVNLGHVRYRGLQNSTSGITSFYGIKYAKSPVGNLRWRPPVPIDTKRTHLSDDAVDATVRGPTCIQSVPPWSPGVITGEQNEDCLLLDILTPVTPISAKLPVLVQIHGGGYSSGSVQSSPGNAIVHQSNGSLIYVAIQYRLGPLGFLAGDKVASDGSWNVGLLDQRAALNWIRTNIHHFGGDPSKVTITGGSAGGASVTLQMVLYGGSRNPPFRSAIPGNVTSYEESVFYILIRDVEYPWWTPIYSRAWLNRQYNIFMEATNCTILSCLRSISTNAIQSATVQAYQTAYEAEKFAYGTFYWGPAIDGRIIRDHPIKEFRDGHFTKVPIMVDRDGYEGLLFSNFSMSTDEDLISDLSVLWPQAPESLILDAMALYSGSEYDATNLKKQPIILAFEKAGGPFNLSDAYSRRQSIFGDAIVNCPSNSIMTAVSRAGLRAYKMVFNAGSQVHGATVPYLFSETIEPSGAEVLGGFVSIAGNGTLAMIMRNYFVSFTRFLDPNALSNNTSQPVTPFWPEYILPRSNVLSVGFDDINVVSDPDDSAQCNFLETSFASIAGV